MKILNYILINLLLLSTTYAQDDYHTWLLNQLETEYGLSGGTFVIDDNEADNMNVFNHFNGSEITPEQRMTVSEKNMSNQAFTKAFELNTPVRLPDGVNTKVGSKIKNRQNIDAGDNLLLVFWARGDSNLGGFNGVAKVQVEGNGKIYKRITYFNEEWTQYLIPIEANDDYDAGELAFSFSLGYWAQTIQFGGYAVLNFGSTDLSDIPDTAGYNAYQGISPNAPWRSEAQSRIESFRKADLQVKVVDQNDNPIDGALVEVDMNQHHFGFGTAVNLKYLPFNDNSSTAIKYWEKIFDLDGNGHGFNEVVFENALEWKKWEENIPTSKENKIKVLDYLIEKGIKVRGHSLLWPRFDRLPDDMEENEDNSSYLKNRIIEHIDIILQNDDLKGKFVDWDAINEITNKRDIEKALANDENVGREGRAFYDEILRLAKDNARDTPMYLNDYMTISYGGIGEKYDSCKNFLKEVYDAGAPFDGIGFQAHLREAPIGIPTVYSILEDFNQTFNGEKDFKITEFDMRSTDDSILKQYTKDFLTICFSHEKMQSFITWGFWDGQHWKEEAPFFYKNWQIKPSGEAFNELVFSEWWTNEETTSNSNGQANVSAFKGKHTIRVTHNGETVTKDVDLTEDQSISISLNVEEEEEEEEEEDQQTPELDIYYVSNNGNDSNDGTGLEPWKTIQHAANKAEAGKTVIIKPGIYKEYVKLKKSGTPDNYITFIGEDRDAVILQGDPSMKSAFESSKSSYIRIEQMTIQDYHEEGIGFNNTGVTKYNIRLKNLNILNSGYERGLNCFEYTGSDNKCWDHGIRMANVENFIIDNCYVYNSWGNNIHVHECKNGAVINSTVKGLEDEVFRDDSDGISIQNSERIVVRNCVASFNGEDGIDVGGYGQEGRENKDIKHIRVINCIAKNNKDDGFCNNVTRVNAHDGEDVTFANNLSVGNASYGITCYSNSDDVKLVHNTVADNKWALHLRDNPQSFKIKNNIFSFSSNSNLDPNDTDPEELEISNNNWFGDLPSQAFRGANAQNENPAFAENVEYTLSNDSPCIDYGAALTRTTNSGSNTKTIKVGYSKYFCDGFGVVSGDIIDVAGQQVEVAEIPDENTIKVSEAISWDEGDPVNFTFNGNAPDLGWKENLNPPVEQSLLGDVDCDGDVDAVDALALMQYTVGQRTESPTCPLQNPSTEIYAVNGDVNNSGAADATDALLILQCSVGVINSFCENTGARNATPTGGLLNTDKHLKVYPSLFNDFITFQYKNKVSRSVNKMIYVTNIYNQIVRKIEIPNQPNWSTVIPTTDFVPGLYIVTMIDGKRKEVYKLIKTKG